MTSRSSRADVRNPTDTVPDFALGETVLLTGDPDRLTSRSLLFAGQVGVVAKILPNGFYEIQFAHGEPVYCREDALTAKSHDYPACAVYRGGKCTCD